MNAPKQPNYSSDESRYHVPSLVRALKIMEMLSTESRALGLSEIADKMAIPKNSAFRILTTLSDYEYVIRDSDQKLYRLSKKLISLGYEAIDEANLLEKSLAPMKQLRRLTGETVLLGTLSSGKGVVLDIVPSPHPIKVVVEVGHQFPLHSAAPGKVLLAFLDRDECEQIIDQLEFTKFTESTITSKSAFRLELARIRENGYALDRGEEVEEIHCVAAPIRNHRGNAIAAIWVTGPKTRLQKHLLDKYRRQVMAQSDVVSEQLGYGKTTHRHPLNSSAASTD
ncbi:Transcriptional regulator KdgR [Rosistilla ulvae]|uniref:Transcriptional regulator KdgR n=1 Tax=Rosistilla ulvae TaxID=1930277 RepID=A0A517LVI7_9BACT|nr:IclR family transcriptional regulator [Rosistilla ulvae]QDS86633.1 Transcriptional regulator KdgR [Rosistilla ulvae]